MRNSIHGWNLKLQATYVNVLFVLIKSSIASAFSKECNEGFSIIIGIFILDKSAMNSACKFVGLDIIAKSGLFCISSSL